METPRKRFIRLLRNTCIEDLITCLNNSDLFKAPASTRYHCAYEGGNI